MGCGTWVFNALELPLYLNTGILFVVAPSLKKMDQQDCLVMILAERFSSRSSGRPLKMRQ